MKRLRTINAADEGSSKLADTLDALKEDFDFIISGLEKLDRSGAEASNDGLIIAERLSNDFADVVSEIADKMS